MSYVSSASRSGSIQLPTTRRSCARMRPSIWRRTWSAMLCAPVTAVQRAVSRLNSHDMEPRPVPASSTPPQGNGPCIRWTTPYMESTALLLMLELDPYSGHDAASLDGRGPGNE
ncbi:MAG: hypothetical protein WC284_03380 [Candidimonas sp.]